MITKLAPAVSRVEPTSLLNLIAGEFASRVAAVWPAPHAGFLTAPAVRRHLVCLALTVGRDLAALRATLLGDRLKRAIPAAVRGAPAGLERALARIGDVAWPAEDYRKLLALLASPQPAKLLRHAAVIEVETVRRLAELPAAMAPGAVVAMGLSGDMLAALRETYAAIELREGPAAAEAAAARWARASSAKALVEAARDDLYPDPAPPPFPGTPRLRPLATKAAIRDAARRYRNCLRDYTAHAASGWSALYEWEGAPGAVLDLTRDAIYGWRLEQVRLADNAAVPQAMRSEIVSELALMGVHVGRSCWELDRALAGLEGHAMPLRPIEHVLAGVFGD